jgi:hypothetical protein
LRPVFAKLLSALRADFFTGVNQDGLFRQDGILDFFQERDLFGMPQP